MGPQDQRSALNVAKPQKQQQLLSKLYKSSELYSHYCQGIVSSLLACDKLATWLFLTSTQGWKVVQKAAQKKGGRRKELGPLLGKVWGEGGWATGLENSQTFLSSSNNAKLVLRLEHVQGFTRFPLAPLRVCASVYKCWHFYNYSISWNHRCRFIFTAEPVASPKCVNCAPKDSAPTGKRIQWQKSPLASQPQSLGSLTCFWVGQIHCHFSRSVLIWAECQLQFEAAFRAGMHEEIRQWRMLTAHTNIST